MGKKKTILLVDDDPTFVEATKIALEKHYEIETAKDGKDCLSKIKSVKPDLILLDIMMRHLGEGIDVAKELKSDNATAAIPIIMLTGVNEVFDLSTQVDKSQLKYDSWLEKPVESDQLLKEIGKFI